MSQQTIRQQARRAAREMAAQRRNAHEERERRVISLAEQVMVALGERDAAVTETEKRAGEALRDLTGREGLSVSEAVEWCGETVTVREASRLRRLAGDPQADANRDLDADPPTYRAPTSDRECAKDREREGSQASDATPAGAGSGGVVTGPSAG